MELAKIIYKLLPIGTYQITEVSSAIIGFAISVKGKLVESGGKGQLVELQAKEVGVWNCGAEYPFKKGNLLQVLRDQAHLRSRTQTFGA